MVVLDCLDSARVCCRGKTPNLRRLCCIATLLSYISTVPFLFLTGPLLRSSIISLLSNNESADELWKGYSRGAIPPYRPDRATMTSSTQLIPEILVTTEITHTLGQLLSG